MEVKEANYKETNSLLIRNISSTFASNVGTLALGFVSSIILNRALGPEGKGVYAFLLTTTQLLVVLATFGIGKAATYFLAAEQFGRREVFTNFLTLATGAGLIGLLALSVLNFVPAYRSAINIHFTVLACLFFFSLIHGLGMSALRGLKNFNACNVLGLLTSALFILVMVLTSFHGTLNPAAAILAKASAFGLVLFFVVHHLYRQRLPFKLGFDRALLKKMLGYGFGFFFYGVFQNLNYRFDLILVSHLTNHASAGWYSTGTGLAEIIWYFPNAVGMVLFPVAAGLQEKQSDALVARVCRWSLLVMALAAVGLAVAAPWIVRLLYGAEFLPTITVIHSLCGGIVTNGMFQILGLHLATRKKLGLLTRITATGFVVNVLLNLWMIPRWGIMGAGLAATISYSVTGLLTARAFVRLTGLAWSELFIVPRREFQMVAETLRAKLAGLTG